MPEKVSENHQLEQDEKKDHLESEADSEDSLETAASVIEEGT